MKTAVKICGLTRAKDVAHAANAGADFVGFVFVRSSPRLVTLELATTLRRSAGKAKVVGVFAGASAEDIECYVREVGLDYVQLHGDPDHTLCGKLSVPVIQAFRGVPDEATLRRFLSSCPYVLIDKADGQGHVDLGQVASLPADIRSRLFLAGGLNPATVRDAIDRVHPFAADSARGVESSPGIKDHTLISAFISALS